MGFSGGSDGKKKSSYLVGDLGLIPGLRRSPGGGHGNPLQYSCLENPHGQRSLAGYSQWGHKELDMTEQLSTAHQVLNLWITFFPAWSMLLYSQHILLTLGQWPKGQTLDSCSWFGESLFLHNIFHLWGISTYLRWRLGVRLLFLLSPLVIPTFLRSDLRMSTFLATLEGAAFSEGWPLVSPIFSWAWRLLLISLVWDRSWPDQSLNIYFLYSSWLSIHWINISANQTRGHSVHNVIN